MSSEMEDYLHEMGIEHRLTTPLWARANGEVERQNRSLLKAMRVVHAHTTTGKSLAELLYGRQIGTTLPELAGFDGYEATGYQETRDCDAEIKQLKTYYADNRNQAGEKHHDTERRFCAIGEEKGKQVIATL